MARVHSSRDQKGPAVRRGPAADRRRGLRAGPFAGGLVALIALLVFVAAGLRPAIGQEGGVKALLERGRTAGADVEALRKTARRARRLGYGGGETAALLRPVVALAEQGLPAELLRTTILEGVAKDVSPEELQSVLRRQRTYTEQADRLVRRQTRRGGAGRRPGAGEQSARMAAKSARAKVVVAVAKARARGLSARQAERVLGALSQAASQGPAGRVVAALSTLSRLRGEGVSVSAASRLLASALGAGYDQGALRELPSALERARQMQRRPASMIAGEAVRAIARGAPAAAVLQGRFPTGLPGGLPGEFGPFGTQPAGTIPGVRPPGTPGRPGNPGPPEAPSHGGG